MIFHMVSSVLSSHLPHLRILDLCFFPAMIIASVSRQTYYFTPHLDKYRPPRCRPLRNYTKTDHQPQPHSQIIIDLLFGNCGICPHAASRFFMALAQNIRTPPDLDRNLILSESLRSIHILPHCQETPTSFLPVTCTRPTPGIPESARL